MFATLTNGFGILTACLCIAMVAMLAFRAHAMSVDALIEAIEPGKPYARVSYIYKGATYRMWLASKEATAPWAVGQYVQVFVNPIDPTRPRVMNSRLYILFGLLGFMGVMTLMLGIYNLTAKRTPSPPPIMTYALPTPVPPTSSGDAQRVITLPVPPASTQRVLTLPAPTPGPGLKSSQNQPTLNE